MTAVLDMMAAWRLDALQADLAQLAVPLTLIVNAGDRTVPASEAERVQRIVPGASVVRLPRLGHLSHEEDPVAMADLMLGLIDCAVSGAGAQAPSVDAVVDHAPDALDADPGDAGDDRHAQAHD